MSAVITFFFSALLMINMRRVSKLQYLRNINYFTGFLKVI